MYYELSAGLLGQQDAIVFSKHAFSSAPEILNTVDVVKILLGNVGAVFDTKIVEF